MDIEVRRKVFEIKAINFGINVQKYKYHNVICHINMQMKICKKFSMAQAYNCSESKK